MVIAWDLLVHLSVTCYEIGHRDSNRRLYKQVPCYDHQGELFSFVLVEVASGPAVPPESIFEEPETPVQEATLEEDIVDSMEETTALEVAETPAVEEPSETPEQVVESI